MNTTTATQKTTEPKPVKLRSACNCCFSAKVRCDGNKQGCKRCLEKRLECTYSESMVGRVVGKRRKRPLPDSKPGSKPADPKAPAWNGTIGPTAIPSPAPTVVSEQYSRESCSSEDWTAYIAYDDNSSLDINNGDEQPYLESGDMGDYASKDTQYPSQVGLPTPSMSPPQMQYLSPSNLRTVDHTIPTSTGHSNFEHPQQPTFQQPQNFYTTPQVEDDETVCIKLLAQLKQSSMQPQRSLNYMLCLIAKVNNVVQTLLQNRSIQADYTCHLLLTNVMLHLTTLCENVLLQLDLNRVTRPEEEFIHESYLTDQENEQAQSSAQAAVSRSISRKAVHDTAAICAKIGDLLKRKPLNGFQILGRHESAHVEIDIRLKHVLAMLA